MNFQMKNLKIEIKNLKHSEFASQETHCFEATVYINGKREFIASNDGWGGCNSYHPLKADGTQRDVYERVKEIDLILSDDVKNLDSSGNSSIMIMRDLDITIAELINDALMKKDFKKCLRQITYIHGDGIYQVNRKVKPTPENIERVKKASWYEDTMQILNELPFDEALKMYQAV